jgi:ketosteroid isomerase-like protein
VANAMIASWVDSWNRSDGLAYGDGYWQDAELVDPSGRMWSGRTAMQQRHVDLWAGDAAKARGPVGRSLQGPSDDGHCAQGVVKLSGTGEPGLAKRRESSRMAVSQ